MKELTSDQLPSLNQSLRRYCLALTGSEWEADDLAQETWSKSLERLRKEGHANPEAFLLRVARNSWIDWCRRKAMYIDRLQAMKEPEARRDGIFIELELVFQALMKHMPPLQRTVFMLREVLDYSIAETANWLDMTEGAVKSALYRARQSLETIREDLRLDESGERAFDGDRFDDGWLLQQIAVAYESGDVPYLIQLLLQDAARQTGLSVHAVGVYHAHAHASNGQAGLWSVNNKPSMKMTA